jgi:hypothetical protein
MQLRPLSLGELLDRAVTLCVRHALTFALIFLVFIVPFAILQAFALPDQTAMWNQLGDLVRSGGKAVAHTSPVPANPTFTALTGIWFVGFCLFSPFSYAALAFATSRAYLGENVTFADAYRSALPAWLRLIGLTLLYFLTAIVVVIAIMIVGGAIAFTAVLLARVSMPLGIIFGVVFGGAFMLALVVFWMVSIIAGYLCYYTCLLERTSATAAFGRGIRRAFGQGNFVRSLLAGLALTAVSLGFATVSMMGSVTALALFRSGVAAQLVTALLQAPAAAFFLAFMTLYYYDLRVRNEGFDLRIDAAAPAPVADPNPG